MNKIIRTLLTAVATTSLLFAAGTASAHDRDHDRRDRHEWRGDDRHGHGHWKKHRHEERHARYRDHRTVVTERVVVRERPIYRHYESRPVYVEPGIVVGVNLPPLIIPFR